MEQKAGIIDRVLSLINRGPAKHTSNVKGHKKSQQKNSPKDGVKVVKKVVKTKRR
jgi:hypothetical protein